MTYIYYYYRISDDNTYMGHSMSTRPGADLIFLKIFNKFHYYNRTESYVSVLSTLLANDPAECNSNIYGKTDEQLVAEMSALRPSTYVDFSSICLTECKMKKKKAVFHKIKIPLLSLLLLQIRNITPLQRL